MFPLVKLTPLLFDIYEKKSFFKQKGLGLFAFTLFDVCLKTFTFIIRSSQEEVWANFHEIRYDDS